tara:strand:- start:461 stop:664 length:204 start_codon:yes stop_codon:yes gene_type:complete
VTLILIVAGLGILAGLAFAVFRAGATSQRAKVMEQDLDAAERINDVQSDEPANLDELRERLRRGGKL